LSFNLRHRLAAAERAGMYAPAAPSPRRRREALRTFGNALGYRSTPGGGIVLTGLWLGKQAALNQRAPHTPAPGRQEVLCPFWSPAAVIAASFGSSQSISLSRSPHNSSHGPQQRGNLSPGLNRLGRIAAMLERIDVTLGSARRLSAVQTTTAVRHRGRLAPAPLPCPRSTSAAEVHRRFALQGLFLKFWATPSSPRGPNHADDGLAAGMHVDVLHRHLLLALAAMPVQSIEQPDIGWGQLVGLVQVLTSAVGRLLREHRAPVTFHRGIVRGEELCRDHPLKLIFGPDCGERQHDRGALTVLFLFL
jgi:hypothetical protein